MQTLKVWLSARISELDRKRKDRFITNVRRLFTTINNFGSENEWWEKIHFVHFLQNDRQKNTYSKLETITVCDISTDFERLGSITEMLKACILSYNNHFIPFHQKWNKIMKQYFQFFTAKWYSNSEHDIYALSGLMWVVFGSRRVESET